MTAQICIGVEKVAEGKGTICPESQGQKQQEKADRKSLHFSIPSLSVSTSP